MDSTEIGFQLVKILVRTIVKCFHLVNFYQDYLPLTLSFKNIIIVSLWSQLQCCEGINPFIPEFLKWTLLSLNLNMYTDANKGFISLKNQKPNGKQWRS